MPIIILSDLHIGSPLSKWHPELVDWDLYDRIILAGDIFDVWEFPWEYIKRVFSFFIEAFQQLSERKYVVYIQGNHDPTLEHIKETFPKMTVPDCGYYNLHQGTIIHGHEFDDLVIHYSKLAKLLNVGHWILERVGIDLKSYFNDLFYSIANKENKDYYSNLVSSIEFAAVEKYSQTKEWVIMGHTHHPKFYQRDGFRYVNSGDLVKNLTYVVYDEIKEELKLEYF